MRLPLRSCLPLLVGALAALAPASAEAGSAQPRVVSGTQMPISAHPYQARLRIRAGTSSYLCGGVIRDATHVMTAAHCVVSAGSVAAPTDVTVFYGSADQNAQLPAGVLSVTPASQYVAGDETYDAALLTLATPLVGYGGSSVRGVPLASSAESSAAVASGASAIVSGWGITEQGTTSRYLNATSVALRADGVCRSTYGGYFASDRFVCAGGTGSAASNNPDACNGDSGGPLVLPTASGDHLIGLVSFGPAGACGQPGVPGAYTEVSSPAIKQLLTSGAVSLPAPGGQAPAGRPTAPASDRVPPKVSIAGASCHKRRCRIRVHASDEGGRVRGVTVRASRRTKRCRGRGALRHCVTVVTTRRVATKSSDGDFGRTVKLRPGRYKISAVATDEAGNRSSTATRGLRVRR